MYRVAYGIPYEGECSVYFDTLKEVKDYIKRMRGVDYYDITVEETKSIDIFDLMKE